MYITYVIYYICYVYVCFIHICAHMNNISHIFIPNPLVLADLLIHKVPSVLDTSGKS